MDNLLGGILNFECGRHSLACLWRITTSSVEAVDALEVASCAIHSSKLEPCNSTISLIALSLDRACWGRRTTSLATWQRSDLLLGSIQVEEGDTGISEEVQARDLEVGGVRGGGVGAQVELQGEAGEGVEDQGRGGGDARGVVEGCYGADGLGDCGGVGGVAGVVLDAAADGDVLEGCAGIGCG